MPQEITLADPDLDPRAVEQLITCVEAVEGARGALCADAHVGYSAPIGAAIAYPEHISPSGVGYDIGCGNKAVLTDILFEDIKDDLGYIMDEIVAQVSFGMGRSNPEPLDHPVLDAIRAADFAPQRQLADLAAKQLGTVGAGNHYVDLFKDNLGRVWVGVHFGSRGFGHKTASGFLAMAQGAKFEERGRDGEMFSPPVLFHQDSGLGQSYIAAMTLAGDYAYAGRDVVVDEVLRILGGSAIDVVHNHHNYAWREAHYGQFYWVVRKGCTPAWVDQRGFVGATMGEKSAIIKGGFGSQALDLLRSAPHGAGRVMSRTKAAGKLRKRWSNNVRDNGTLYETEAEALAYPGATKARHSRVRVGGAIDWTATRKELIARGIEIRGGDADEAPLAYKRLHEVLDFHRGSIEVEQWLQPIGVAMAPRDTFDAFKD